MSSPLPGDEPAAGPSGVSIDTTAKGYPVVKVRAFDGVSEQEMQRLTDLAVGSYRATLRQLGLQIRTELG